MSKFNSINLRQFFCLILFVVFSFSVNAELLDRVAAVVNNELILESEIRTFSSKLEKAGLIDDMLLLGEKIDSLKKDKDSQLNYLINEKILESEIKRLNLTVTMDRVDQEIKDHAKRNNMSKSDLLTAVKSQGLSVSEYQDFMKSRIERQSLIESEVSSKIRVSDDDVAAVYTRNNPNSPQGVFEYSLAHIFFNSKKGGPSAAEERAKKVLNKLVAGENFEVLAEQNSEDSNFSTGGILGVFKAGEFSKEMESAVKNLNTGEYSNIVSTKSGIHILKVLSKKLVSDPKFEKEKEKIRSEIFEKSFQKYFKNWLESKKEESYIRINKS